MISYGTNGKMSGAWIITEMIEKRMVSFPSDGLTVRDGHHEVVRVDFSGKVKEDPELRMFFREAVRDFLGLYRFAEQNEGLLIPEKNADPSLYEKTETDFFSGMTLLNLFAQHRLNLTPVSKTAYILYAERDVLEGIKNSEEILTELVKTCLRYSGEEEECQVLVLPRSGFVTRTLSDDLSVSYSVNGSLEAELLKNRTEFHAEEEKQEASLVESGVKDTLNLLKQMMDTLGENKEELKREQEFPELTYMKDTVFKTEDLVIGIPDGFKCGDRDGFTMWRPNPENEEEAEASSFQIRLEEEKCPFTGTEPVLVSEGAVTRYVFQIPGDSDAFVFTAELLGIQDENKQAAFDAVRTAASHIKLR